MSTGATSSCPGETEQINSFTASGTVTFNPDGTYSTSTSTSLGILLTIPSSCLSQGGVTISCSTLASGLGANADAGQTATCMTSGSNCDCTLTETSASSTGMGTYTTSGSTVTTTQSGGGTPSANSYCVQGNTLYFMQNTAAADAGTTGNIVATIVGTKQ